MTKVSEIHDSGSSVFFLLVAFFSINLFIPKDTDGAIIGKGQWQEVPLEKIRISFIPKRHKARIRMTLTNVPNYRLVGSLVAMDDENLFLKQEHETTTRRFPLTSINEFEMSWGQKKPVYGQTTHSKGPPVWFRGGYDAPTGIGLELAFQPTILIVEGRLTGKEVIPDDASGWDFALLIGLATPPTNELNLHVALTAGVAITFFNDPYCRDDSRVCLNNSVPALAFSFHASYRPLPFLGLGFFVHSNINNEKSFGGSGFMIELGKLR